MRILIIATWYPPDTSIAAVRPYMLAKYLSRLGHAVTVFRSGAIRQRCDAFFEELPDVRVISYLGKDSPAEKFSRGEWAENLNQGKSRIYFIPEKLRMKISKVYHTAMKPVTFFRAKKRAFALFEQQKAALEELKEESFDIVFSTFGEVENIFAGQYAARLFCCPLIQDFRDPLANRTVYRGNEYRYWKKIQENAVQEASFCTAVSEGVLNDVCSGLDVKNKMVLHNGYEPVSDGPKKESVSEFFSFCYTGQFYGGLQDFTPLLKAIQTLSREGKVSMDRIRIHYAGRDFEWLHQKAAELGVEKILTNHGYVSRNKAAELQEQADVFVVLAWNRANSKGILTGKFFEGIRAEKPILSLISGNVPNSELYRINEKYHYGFCYEEARDGEQFRALCSYLEKAYQEKMQFGKVNYVAQPSLAEDFRYDTLAKRLEAVCLDLIGEK